MAFKLRKALSNEINKGLSLLREAALWLRDNNINYWQNWLNPSKEHIAWIKQGFDNKEFYFVENERFEIMGMFRLQFEDEVFWGKNNDKAGYIHSFTIDRNFKGNQIGYSVLCSIEELLSKINFRILRLDCSPDIRRLCKYYEDFGFIQRGIITVHNEKLQLYEKTIVNKV